MALLVAILLVSCHPSCAKVPPAADVPWSGTSMCQAAEATPLEAPRREEPPPKCGCSAGGGSERSASSFPRSVPIPRTVARIQSAIATVMLLPLLLCLSTMFVAGLSTKSKAMRRTVRPALGVAKQWAGNLRDVFIVFPWKAVLLLLRLSVVMPLQALCGISFAIHAARKAQLQRQLLEETAFEGDHPEAKPAKQERSGSRAEPKARRRAGQQDRERKKACSGERGAGLHGPAAAVAAQGHKAQRSDAADESFPARAARSKTGDGPSGGLAEAACQGAEAAEATARAEEPNPAVQRATSPRQPPVPRPANSMPPGEPTQRSPKAEEASLQPRKGLVDPDAGAATSGFEQKALPQRPSASEGPEPATRAQVAEGKQSPTATATEAAPVKRKVTMRKVATACSHARAKDTEPRATKADASRVRPSSNAVGRSGRAAGPVAACRDAAKLQSPLLQPSPPNGVVPEAPESAAAPPVCLATLPPQPGRQATRKPAAEQGHSMATHDGPQQAKPCPPWPGASGPPPEEATAASASAAHEAPVDPVAPPPIPAQHRPNPETGPAAHPSATSPPPQKPSSALGPPPPGPAPPPPVSAPMDAIGHACMTLGGFYNGWSTGGTGGTADLGWNSEAVIQMMAQQAQVNAQFACGAHGAEAGADSGAAEEPPAPAPKLEAVHLEAPAPAPPGAARQLAEEDVGSWLEAMVEDLAGVDSFTLLEDAYSKVDAAREALSKVLSDSGLRHSAPAFIPGQMWPGQQRSSFVD